MAVKVVAQEGKQLSSSVSQPPSADTIAAPKSMQQAHGAAAEGNGRAEDAPAGPAKEQGEDANGWSFEGFDLPAVAESHAEHGGADAAGAEQQQQDAGASARPDGLEHSQAFSVLAGVSTQIVQQRAWSAQEQRQEGAGDASAPPWSKGSTPKSLVPPKAAPAAPQEAPASAPNRSIPIPTGARRVPPVAWYGCVR